LKCESRRHKKEKGVLVLNEWMRIQQRKKCTRLKLFQPPERNEEKEKEEEIPEKLNNFFQISAHTTNSFGNTTHRLYTCI